MRSQSCKPLTERKSPSLHNGTKYLVHLLLIQIVFLCISFIGISHAETGPYESSICRSALATAKQSDIKQVTMADAAGKSDNYMYSHRHLRTADGAEYICTVKRLDDDLVGQGRVQLIRPQKRKTTSNNNTLEMYDFSYALRRKKIEIEIVEWHINNGQDVERKLVKSEIQLYGAFFIDQLIALTH